MKFEVNFFIWFESEINKFDVYHSQCKCKDLDVKRECESESLEMSLTYLRWMNESMGQTHDDEQNSQTESY